MFASENLIREQIKNVRDRDWDFIRLKLFIIKKSWSKR